MDAVGMQHSVTSKLQGLNLHPDFLESYRIQKFLNEAQDMFVDLNYPQLASSEAARKRLARIIKNYSVAPSASGVDNIQANAQFLALPADIKYILQEHCIVSAAAVKVKPISYDEYNINIDDPFKNPNANLIWRLDYGDSARQHEIIHSGLTISTYKARYLANPTAIDIFANTSSIIPDEFHNEIIDIALGLIIARSNDDNK